MKLIEHNSEVEVVGVSDFDLVRIFECGQCFRWSSDDSGIYTGIAKERVARVRREDSSEGTSVFISGTIDDFENIWREYFDIDRDYYEIRHALTIDEFMKNATEFGAGIRILQQDRWEALCSFIISQNNNIPRIKGIVNALCIMFGDNLKFEGKDYYTFPSAKRLAELDESDLEEIRSGYRAKYLISAARDVASGMINLDTLAKMSPKDAKSELKKMHGVGDKVADCFMLFGLSMLDSFPVDVWMKRAIEKHYGYGFDPNVFSPYAGIAQQYIFYYIRNMGVKSN